MKYAIIGLGEVGQTYGTALVDAGNEVIGFDPFITDAVAGIALAPSAADAAKDADTVLVLTGSGAAQAVADECLPVMAAGSFYADFTSSSPEMMQKLGAVAGAVRFIDVAILGPVIAQGVRTPLMVSGDGAQTFAAQFEAIGAPITVVEGGPGSAMAHKLIRSVFMKGLASVVIEAVSAGSAAGLDSWIRGEIAQTLAGDGQATIDRFIAGTAKHAVRRAVEMRSTASYLSDLGVPHEMTTASACAMERMSTRNTSTDG
ncbi:DUF1932 domain-containing protein [Glutamicibacter sp. PS]|uniref:NAD(P)-dependent oxidoreductase n=1 Tax=Glutamicibacter sp. PS TaxID=3075634 RepID=UPI002840B3AC|nr:DUF1932 domain-containing protein [Glutamicibacter sp. PS]MDR4534576.1 DUF1932 domain-containing protein [Glutamicibacter sp. PS]